VARLVSTLLVLGLLGGTAAAFAVTEHLKLVRSPIYRTEITNTAFSPVCRCSTRKSRIRFYLRQADRLTLSIENDDQQVVRTIVADHAAGRGRFARWWDGRDDAGARVASGLYLVRIDAAGTRLTRRVVVVR